MYSDEETEPLLRAVGGGDATADVDETTRVAPEYLAMPVSFLASCAMAVTAASTVYANAHMVYKDATQCANREKPDYAPAVAVATTLIANIFELLAVDMYQQLSTSTELIVWVGLRAGSVLILAAGGEPLTRG